MLTSDSIYITVTVIGLAEQTNRFSSFHFFTFSRFTSHFNREWNQFIFLDWIRVNHVHCELFFAPICCLIFVIVCKIIENKKTATAISYPMFVNNKIMGDKCTEIAAKTKTKPNQTKNQRPSLAMSETSLNQKIKC